MLALGACGDEEEDDHGGSEHELTGDCKVISEACHDLDEGEGEVGECHEIAHENDTGACTEKKDDCVTACEEHSGH